jgi:glycerol-3-phosphate dehydrogenase
MPLVDDMRPAWMIRTGLFLYDHIGGKTSLPKSEGVKLEGTPWGAGLKPIERGFVYSPTVPDNQARRTALSQIVRTFFKGSPVSAASALVGMAEDLDASELDELEAAIARARQARESGK